MLRTFSIVLALALLPPSSSEQMVVGVAGNPISMPCPGWGGGTCSWNVSTSSSRVATDLSSCELKLNPLLPEDAGVHKCSTGQVQLQVKVEPGPPVILEAKEGGRLEVKEGEEVRLECQSQGGIPPAELIWRQEGSAEVERLRGTKQHVEKREDGRTFRTTSVHYALSPLGIWKLRICQNDDLSSHFIKLELFQMKIFGCYLLCSFTFNSYLGTS